MAGGWIMRWFDTHCHLNLLPAGSATEALRKADLAGVDKILVPGIAGSPPISEIASENIEIFYAWGIHPGFIDSAKFDFTAAAPWQSASRPIAIGECGLDRRLHISIEKQVMVFVRQVELAKLHNLPVIVHQVGYPARTLQILKSAALEAGFVIHSYSGSPEMAAEFVAIGGKISLSAACLRKPEKLQRLLAAVPLSALLLETDSPDMRLPDWPEKHNEPAALPEIAAAVARICGLSVENLAEVVYTNAVQFFKLPERDKQWTIVFIEPDC